MKKLLFVVIFAIVALGVWGQEDTILASGNGVVMKMNRSSPYLFVEFNKEHIQLNLEMRMAERDFFFDRHSYSNKMYIMHRVVMLNIHQCIITILSIDISSVKGYETLAEGFNNEITHIWTGVVPIPEIY